MLLLGCLLGFAGCERVGDRISEIYDSKLPLDEPVDWWHQLQGGVIAQERPPPPGITDPYPNFSAVPPRPTPTSPADRRALLARLAAQRDATQQLAHEEPVVWPVPGAPTAPQAPPTPASGAAAKAPQTAGAAKSAPPAQTQPQEQDQGIKATIDAASAPPPPAQAVRPAAPAAPPPPAFSAPPQHAQPAAAQAGPAAPIPPLPTGAPPIPELPGVPASTFAPATPRPLPSASFAFAAGSDQLPARAEAALRELASHRSGATIAVSAGGDASSAAPDAQAAALPLALRRTGAITAALIGAGVPPTALRTEAAALGRDGSARLVN